MIYKFRDGARLSGNAQAVGEELDAIRMRTSALTPQAVLASARRPDSVLHSYFEWDDAKAAEAHRIDQAGHIIRAVVVVIDPEPARQESLLSVSPAPAAPAKHVRAFVPVQTPAGDRVYLSTTEALADGDYRQQVLRQAHQELDSTVRKYRELKELSEVIAAVDHVGQLLKDSSAAVMR